jgi:hypothetical protein
LSEKGIGKWRTIESGAISSPPTYVEFAMPIAGPSLTSGILPDRAATPFEGNESAAQSIPTDEYLRVHNAKELRAALLKTPPSLSR